MTADQARQLAESFDSVAATTSKYIKDNRETLTEEEIFDLVKKISKLHLAATKIQTKALGLDLAEAQTSLTALKNLTVLGKKAIRDIEEVGKVIVLVTTLVTLAGAVAAQNPALVAQSIIAVGGAINDLNEEPEN